MSDGQWALITVLVTIPGVVAQIAIAWYYHYH
jgi:hypothetical protein